MSWTTEIDNCLKNNDTKINLAKKTTQTHKPKYGIKHGCQPRLKQNKPVKQSIRNVDYKRKTALVESSKGKVYPVTLSDQALAKNVTETDTAIVRKVNGYWIMIDVEKPTIKQETESSTSQLFTEDFEWVNY
jgi:hypothetical protein